ncbi:MAG: hypothetical protein QM652_05035 [Legionella sp.]|uniref:hypothetical protein n=1 Tax=Legionella sp. TaxID=459 RepID=UPI0039E4764C
MQRQLHQSDYYSLGEPFQELMDLNIKTFKTLSSNSSLNLLKSHKPEELLDLNVETFVQNSCDFLEYFQDACNILEKYWLTFSYDVLEQNHQLMKNPAILDLDAAIHTKTKLKKKTHSSRKKAKH